MSIPIRSHEGARVPGGRGFHAFMTSALEADAVVRTVL